MTANNTQTNPIPFSISRRRLISAAGTAFALGTMGVSTTVRAKNVERLTIAVGGKNLYYYMPCALADYLGFFKDEGLDVKVVDFQGGSKSLQAVVGGSADVCSGAFEHTLAMQAKHQSMQAFVLQGRAPQCVFAVVRKRMPDFKNAAELKGKRIGVTAPGSSSHVIANYVLAKSGLSSKDVSVIGIGSGAGAVAAVRAGQVDAFVGLDPVIAELTADHAIQIIADTRVIQESDELFGGPMVAGCLYAPKRFINENPETVTRMTKAVIRAEKWIAEATPEEVMKVVPKAAFLGHPEIYREGFLKNRPALSTDGRFPEGCAQVAAAAIQTVNPALKGFAFSFDSTFTNAFVDAAK